MDALIAAAAQALASGDPLGALNWVALREDGPALALRGIAMARLGDFGRARPLLRRAARAFGAREPVSRARCAVAEAEVALASRDLTWPDQLLDGAREALEKHGDRFNAAYARQLELRRLVLLGRLDEAERKLAEIDSALFPPVLRAGHELVLAGIAMRRLRSSPAEAALGRAAEAARRAGIPALINEVDSTARLLTMPVARRGETPLLLRDVEALFASPALIVDACRHAVRHGGEVAALATRPVLFALARALGEAWPADVPREELVAKAFRGRQADESHRARLRVEIGRLRAALGSLAGIEATGRGFVLKPAADEVVVMARPVEERHAVVLAFLADGEAWSSSALAVALGAGQRTVQRALESLAEEGKIQGFGRGRARRWTTPPVPSFATALLLPAPLPED
jgi:hypothetical protein